MNLISEISSDIGHIPLKEVILQAGIASKANGICQNLGKTLLVCDENTKDFVTTTGERIILPGNQKAELTKAQEISKHDVDYFVAVGSGSLNDIVKYAAHLAGKPYIVFGTAPSMNGYVSANASLLDNGYKKSFAATQPESVYLDLEILENAPQRLILSGIGDSICRSCAQADVLLSRQVLNTPDYANLFNLMRKYEDRIFDDVVTLAKMLVVSGLAMLVAHSSAPASQGEHMLAHYMELMDTGAPHSYHGEQIAVTTLTMAELQEKLLDEKEYVEVPVINEKKILGHFGNEFGLYCIEQTKKKYSSVQKTKINKAEIEKVLVKSQSIRRNLKAIGASIEPEEIGWDKDIYANALRFTKYTRDRFTFLDLQD